MNIEGVGFNPEWAKTKTQQEFVAEFVDVHFQDYARADRISLLKEAFLLVGCCNAGGAAQ